MKGQSMRITYLNRIWLFMVGATLITYTLGESGLASQGAAWPVGMMFFLAYAKGIMVILDFMELRHAPVMWRVLLIGWATLTVAAIGVAWWMGMRGG